MQIEPTRFQTACLQLRTHVDLLIFAGGRGSGKSTAALLALVQHCIDLGPHASVFAVRESHVGLSEFMVKAFALASAVWGKGVSYNKADSVISLPTGGHIYGVSLHEGDAAYVRWQGRNASAIVSEETGLLTPVQFGLMRKLEANLRPPPPYRAERIWSLNPNGPLHQVLMRHWIGKSPPWRAARDHTGLSYVWTASTYRDNPHLPANYADVLAASVGADRVLAEAWLEGHFAPLAGSRFVPDPEVHLIDPLPPYVLPGARFVVGCDYGNSSPSTAVLCAELAHGVNTSRGFVRPGSIVVLEEHSTIIDDNDTTIGSGLDPLSFGGEVRALLGKYDVRNYDCVVDDAVGLKGDTVIGYFADAGLSPVSKPDKSSRIEGWDTIGQLLANTVRGSGQPIYFTTKAPHTFRTLNEAPRGQVNPRDVDARYTDDHFIDGLRYAVTEIAGGPRVWQSRSTGGW